MTSRAKEMGLTTVVKPETAPHLLVFPSIIEASISTVPSVVNTDPLPALKPGWFSSSRTLQQTKLTKRKLYKTHQKMANCKFHKSNEIIHKIKKPKKTSNSVLYQAE